MHAACSTARDTPGRAAAPEKGEGNVTPEFLTKFQEIALTAVATASLLLIEHIAPWERIFGQKPQPPWSYVAGVASLTTPFFALLIRWGEWWAMGAWLAVVIAGGLPVIVGYDVRMRLEFKSLKAELNKAFRLADDLVANIRGKGK
jgi:hypothetical protein